MGVIALSASIAACDLAAGPPAGVSSPAVPSPAVSEDPVAPESLDPDASEAVPESPRIGLIPVDQTLLDLLPESVNGLALEPVTEPEGADDPALVDTVDRLAQAILFDPASGDFAYVSVIALRSGVFDEAFFRSWRDSFDEGACSQSDGLAGRAQAAIDGRTVFIGRCTGGVTTYHVRLGSHDAIVSVSELLDTRLGERIMAGLRP
ncbi:MAG: hypothetical protein M3P84_11480 [Chloroflexota bacterium]|nr:hypothetical protein [Chloroflexota bacterium]